MRSGKPESYAGASAACRARSSASVAARTIARRSERRTLVVEGANPEVVRYLNRLSDLLFILSRVANPDGDVLWKPAGNA